MTRTILVVDDDPLVRRLITTTLRDVGGFAVREAVDGQAGVLAAEALAPSIVFIDYEMPGLDGVEASRRIRALTGTGDATIVMLTGSADGATEAAARAAGVDLFLTKPFSPLDLLRLVDAAARRD